MNSTRWATTVAALALGAAATTTLVTNLEPAAAASGKVVVKTRSVSPYGTILTTSSGRTLYVFTPDSKGRSNCSGACAKEWPPLIVPKGAKIAGPSGIGTIKRGHKRQAALNGHPLYRFDEDAAAGQVKGQGDDGVWFVATPSGASHASPAPKPTKSSPPSGGGYGY